MRLDINSRLTAELYADSDPFNVPSGLSQTARMFAATLLRSDPTIGVHLDQLRDAAIPWIILQGLFDAEAITADTPTAMRPSASGMVGHEAIMAIFVALAMCNLEQMSFIHENEGDVAVNLTPMLEDDLDRLGVAKSKGSLRGHTDASFNPSPLEFAAGQNEFSSSPDYVVLAAVRNPREVPTRIARLSDVVSKLAPSEIVELTRPIFILSPQSSFEIPNFPKRIGPVLWYDSRGVLCCRFSHSNVAVDEGENPYAHSALENFKRVLQTCYQDVVLASGELIVFNNRTLIHGRGEVGEAWSSRARWLIRTYARLPTTGFNMLDPDRPWIAN